MSETEELDQLFTVVRTLGQGAFGKVYECYDNETHKLCAVKVISKDSVKKSKLSNTKQEAGILAKINHNNVVQHYDMIETERGIYIKMQVVQGGNLAELIKKRKRQSKPFTELEISVMMKAILQGVAHIHSLNIIHRDLKTQNILVSNPEDLSTLKIADFGLSIKVNYQTSISTQCGTFLYMAPEILMKTGYTKAVDIYSCAIVMYTLFTLGQHPFYVSHMDTQKYIKIITQTELPSIPNQYQQEQCRMANNFLQKIGKPDALQRYKAQESLRHPWITRNFEDPIPLSTYENFKGFQNSQKIKAVLSASLACHSVCFKGKEQFRKVTDLDYLRKIEIYNKQSIHRSKKQTAFYGTRLTKQSLEPLTKIIRHQRTETSVQKSSESSQDYDKNNPKIQKLNQIFNNLFEKKLDAKYNMTPEAHLISQDKPIQIPTSTVSKIQQLIKQSAYKFKRQTSNKKRIFQKREAKSINKLCSTADINSYRSVNDKTNKTFQEPGSQLKPTRTSIRLRELKIKKTQDLKPPLPRKKII